MCNAIDVETHSDAETSAEGTRCLENSDEVDPADYRRTTTIHLFQGLVVYHAAESNDPVSQKIREIWASSN